MKKYIITFIAILAPLLMLAQGWPADYGGVMLQGFYWDSFSDTKWTNLESQADELAQYFDLIWIPQSGYCGGYSMGYNDLYWFNNYNSSFGTEAELRSMINTFKSRGLGTIADVVINHRSNLSNWVDFPKETYKGKTYEMLSTDIVRNDDGGNTLSWANQNGYALSVNNDSGEGWGGMRDLDHYSDNVQTIVNAYLDFLLNDLGYVGFRYDMVKGYRAGFTGMYNAKANPQFSVGEYWDSATKTASWIRGTADKINSVTDVEAGGNGGIQSAAFDFQFRYTVRNAINGNDWSKLGQANTGQGGYPLVSNNFDNGSGNYRRWAVTFVENHDTEYRSSTAQQDPLKRDTIAANAYMMAMPGTPCVFFKHWLDCKQEIKGMIDVRKAVGITNTSTYSNSGATSSYYANMTTGTKGRLVVIVGNDLDALNPNASTWVEVVRGYHYRYCMDRSMEIAWVDKASGEYPEPFAVKMTAVSLNDNAKLVYTTDGTTPTPTSTQVASGTTLTISANTILKVGLLVNGSVKNVQERAYNFDGQGVITPQLATSISLNQTSANIAVDKTIQLIAIISPSNTTNKAVTWSSSDTNIATVSNSGLVTAKSVGTATITATTQDGSNLSASCQITVMPQLATSITLNETSANIVVDKTKQLTATVSPDNTTNKAVTWSSSDTNIATVSNSGLVTAKSVGTATITATTQDGSNLSASCQVTVTPQLATSVALSQTTASIVVDKTLQLTATISPSNTTDKSVTWSSSDTNIATVSSSGLVTAKAVGNATITVTTNDGSNKSATCQVNVTPQMATGISIDKSTAIIVIDKSLQLVETITPSNTTDKSVTWTSSNTNIATVSSTGLVTAKALGTATITVTTNDGSNISATCHVTVTPQIATGITLSQTTASIVVDKTLQLTATIIPSNTSNPDVTWSSSDTSIATVNSNGLVTAKEVGNVIISATTADGSNLSTSCQVTVTPQLATSITLNQNEAEIGIGDKLTLLATLLPSNTTNTSVRWRSDDTNVATVVRGVVTGVGEGECIITATTQDGSNLSAQCLVIVTQNSNPQGNNYMSSSDIDDIVSGQVITIPIALTNEDQITGFQADLHLPSGFSPMYDEDDNFVYLEPTRTNGHTIGATVTAVATRIVSSSQNNTPFKGNSGNLFFIKLKVKDNLVKGMYRIELKNIYLTTSNAELIAAPNVGINVGIESYHSGDVNGDNEIAVDDYQMTVNYILAREPNNFIYNAADMNGDGLVIINDLPLIIEEIEKFEFPSSSQNFTQQAPAQIIAPNDKVYISNFEMAANKTTSVNIKMKNSFAYSAVQCDITLPPGMSIVTQNDEAGNTVYAILTGSRLNGHQVNSSITSTGNVRVIITNGQNNAITGNSGTIARIKIKTDAYFAGEHQIIFHNVVAAGSDNDAERYTLPNSVVFVNKFETVTGDVNGDGSVDGTDLNILINIILGKDNAANYNGRANVNGQGGIDGNDLNMLINIILGKINYR